MPEIRFVVVIRGRNCEKYLDKCLHSLEKQTYKNWVAMLVLDDNTDKSHLIANEWRYKDERIAVLRNTTRLGLCQNMHNAIMCASRIWKAVDEDVFSILDADDWLSHKALEKVARVFRKHPKILITHGSYIKLSKGRKTRISRPYPKHGNVRKLPWHGSHAKMIKWRILKHIQEDWFKHKGEWLRAASDLALMFPCIEIAGLKRVRHISRVTYYWNDNVTKDKRIVEIECEKILRHKKPLKQLQFD